MKFGRKIVGKCLIATALLVSIPIAATAKNAARVTRVIRDVKLLPPKAEAKPAAVNDNVRDDTAVRTGDESRSELTFVDLRITRLGANTMFTFNKAGHNVQLNSGSILLYVPKDSGGAQMATAGVSVAITGTTVTFQSNRGGRTQLTVLEGGARASLIKYPKESVYVRAGQMVDVPAGANKMPQPVNINLKEAMKSPLITDFPPLPSAPLIATAAPPAPDNSNPWDKYPTHTRPGAPYFPPKNPRPGDGEPGGKQPTNPVGQPTDGGGKVGTQPTNPVGPPTAGGDGAGTLPTDPGGKNPGGGKKPPKKPPFGTVKPPAGATIGGSTPTPQQPILKTTGQPAAGNSTGGTTTGANQKLPRRIAPGRQGIGTSVQTQNQNSQIKKRLKKRR